MYRLLAVGLARGLLRVAGRDLFQRADCVLTFSLLIHSYSVVLIPILRLFKETAIKQLVARVGHD